MSGWAYSRSCLSRQNAWEGNTVPDYTAIMYEDHDDMVAGLLKKEVCFHQLTHNIGTCKPNHTYSNIKSF